MAVLAVALGCGRGEEELMPLQVGSTRSYMVRSGLLALHDTVKVTRRIAVGDVEGYELAGDLGVSHFGWSHGRLITDQVTGARFLPPLPILAPSEETARWRGWVMEGDRKEPAKAEVHRFQQKLDILGRIAQTTRSTVDLSVRGRQVQLQTWFERGVGLVRQEQRTSNRLDLELEYLGG